MQLLQESVRKNPGVVECQIRKGVQRPPDGLRSIILGLHLKYIFHFEEIGDRHCPASGITVHFRVGSDLEAV